MPRSLLGPTVEVKVAELLGRLLADGDLVVVEYDPAAQRLVLHVTHIVSTLRGAAHV